MKLLLYFMALCLGSTVAFPVNFNIYWKKGFTGSSPSTVDSQIGLWTCGGGGCSDPTGGAHSGIYRDTGNFAGLGAAAYGDIIYQQLGSGPWRDVQPSGYPYGEYRANGSGAWLPMVLEISGNNLTFWIGGGPPPDEVTACFTNVSSAAVLIEWVTPSDAVLYSLAPGQISCYTTDEPLALEILEIIPPPPGSTEFLTNRNPIVGWSPSDGSTNININTTDVPKANPGKAGPVNATNITESTDAIVNQIQDSQRSSDSWLRFIWDELKLTRMDNEHYHDWITNKYGSGDTVTNEGPGRVAGALATASNLVVSAGHSVSNAVAPVTGFLGAGDIPTTYTPVSLQLGTVMTTVDFRNLGAVSSLIALAGGLLLWVFKFFALRWLYVQLNDTLKFVGMAAGGASSGWLQAALISMPQLVSTIIGRSLKWGVLASLLVGAGILASLLIVFTTSGNSLWSVISGFPPVITNAVGMLNGMIPILAFMQVLTVCVTIAIGFWITKLVASVTADYLNQV